MPLPPAARVVRLTDFAQLSHLFTQWNGRFEQLSTGRFTGVLRVVQGRSIRVLAAEANQSVLVRGHDTAGLLSVYPVTRANADSLWRGRRFAPGRLIVLGDEAESNHRSVRRPEILSLSLPIRILEAAARHLLRRDDTNAPRNWLALAPAPQVTDALNRSILAILRSTEIDPALFATSEVHQLEQECIHNLVNAMYHTEGSRRPDLPISARVQLVLRAEEFLRAHLAEPVGAVDLCAELGVSDRTLRLAFREYYGVGPMVYYKRLRLNAVRDRLKESEGLSVSVIAREFGFRHLGNFAADYHRQFGELPSETRLGL